MIYLDNAATTHYKPKCVIDSVLDTVSHSYNCNRTGCQGAIKLQQKVYNTRLALSTLVGNDNGDNVVFTNNTTSALNLAILGHAKRGGHIITTACEHNSVLRPLMSLHAKGIVQLDIIYPETGGNGQISPIAIINAIKDNTYMIVINHVSNVTGTMQDIITLGRAIRKAKGDILIVYDCAQSVGYTTIDMARCCADMIAVPAHKGLHGIQGCGALIFHSNSKPRPIILGGTGTESDNLYQPTSTPDGLEAGTLNSVGIVALYSALDWWATNYRTITNTVSHLNKTLIDGLANISHVKLYSNYNCSGIAAFAISHYDSAVVSDLLSSQYDIATRSGLHCAPLMHRYLGTESTGLVRASVAIDNTLEQIYYFLNRIDMISAKGIAA